MITRTLDKVTCGSVLQEWLVLIVSTKGSAVFAVIRALKSAPLKVLKRRYFNGNLARCVGERIICR